MNTNFQLMIPQVRLGCIHTTDKGKTLRESREIAMSTLMRNGLHDTTYVLDQSPPDHNRVLTGKDAIDALNRPKTLRVIA